jgi:hypothetical protein
LAPPWGRGIIIGDVHYRLITRGKDK